MMNSRERNDILGRHYECQPEPVQLQIDYAGQQIADGLKSRKLSKHMFGEKSARELVWALGHLMRGDD